MKLLNLVFKIVREDDPHKLPENSHRKTFYSFIIQAGSAALVAFSNIILARVMGVEEYGVYTFAFSLAFILSGITTSGFVNMLIRRTAAYIETKEYSLLKGFTNWSLKYTLTIGVLVATTACIVFLTINFSSITNKSTILIALITIPLLSLLIIYQSILNGGHFIIQSQLPEKILKPFVIVLGSVIFFVATNNTINSKTTALINIAATLIALAFSFISFKKNIFSLIAKEISKTETSVWVKNYFGLLLLGIIYIINSRLDVLLIGFMRTPEEVGIYNAGSKISEIITFSLFVINIGLAPMISKLYISGQTEALQKLVTKTSRIALFIAIPVLLIIIFAGQYILTLFGEKFIAGYHILIILSIAQMASILAGSSNYLLIMTGNENMATTSLIISLVINVLLSVLLIPKYGIEGAAYATAISTISWNICMATFARIKTGINPTFIGKIN